MDREEFGEGDNVNEWKEYEFSDVLIDKSISYGIVQPGFHTEINSVPIVRVNNIKNGSIRTDDVLKVSSEIEQKYQKTRLEGGELLITVVGSVGECAIVPESLKGWNVARAVSVARIQEGFDKQFIRYCFKSEDLKFQMYGNTNDTVQPTLNLSSLKKLVLSIPPRASAPELGREKSRDGSGS
jgi:type I restriction enzyme, S subunit